MRSGGDSPVCVPGTERDHCQQSREVAAHCCSLGTQEAASGVPFQAETSEQRYRAGGAGSLEGHQDDAKRMQSMRRS